MKRHLLITLALTGAVAAIGCDEGTNLPSVSFGSPIDFSYACEGQSATFRPTVVGDADDPTLCDPEGTSPANLFGLVLNRHPARIHVLQMTVDASLTQGVIDADRFVPGYSGIVVDETPLRLLRTEDWSAFYVLSAGGRSLQRLVIGGFTETGTLDYTLDPPVALPGQPADGVLSGDTLWVASATHPVIWTYTLDADGGLSAPTETTTPARVHTMQRAGDRLLLTWVDRPVMTLMDAGLSTVVSEVGLRPACSDTLDNDADGLADALDPDCRGSQDADEAGDLLTHPADTLDAVAAYPPEVAPCDDGLDNDGDGLIDAHDPACEASPFGEWAPACDDGLDNDGDGLTDTDDDTCYGAHDTSEGDVGTVGPYHAAFVDGRVLDEGGALAEGGDFIYVLDTASSRLLVFSVSDGDDPLTAVVAPGVDADVEALTYEGFNGAEGGALPSIARRPLLGPVANGELGLPLGVLGGVTLNAGQLRGELWSHIVADGRVTPETINWNPAGCAVGGEDGVCVQPEVDDATWYVFMPTLTGEVLLVEAIRRGVPLHRFAQTNTAPEDRGSDIDEPVLSLWGETSTLGSALSQGVAFIGLSSEEELAAAVEGEAPQQQRQYGIWPAGYPDTVDFEGVPSESWTLTYEGAIPNASTTRGRFLDTETFYDPAASFCEAGVETGDWLTLEVAPSSVAPAARAEAIVVTDDGELCPVLAPSSTLIDVPVTAVGTTSLSVDLSLARLRPEPPILDVATIEEELTGTLTVCQTARRALDLEAQVVTATLTTAELPRLARYTVRTAGAWAVVGSRSGFLHANAWDQATGTCAPDPDRADPRYTGRVAQRADATTYDTCPPTAAQMAHDATTPIYTEAGQRFANFSFSLDLFEGCEGDPDGVSAVSTQRDTRWTFELRGPDAPMMTSAARLNSYTGSVLHTARVPQLGLRRQQIQLDTSGRKVHVLQIRANALDHIATFD